MNVYKPIIVEESFKTSKRKVWEAITQLDKMKQWYFSVLEEFNTQIGFKTQFTISVEDRFFVHQWEVKEVIPFKKLSYEWQFEGFVGKGISSFDLTEENGITTLKLTFTVLEKFPDNIPEFKRESGLQGWNYFIKDSLKNYLNC